MGIECDKLTEQHTMKIPEILKVGLSSLSPDQRKKLNIQLMVCIAKAVHDAKFKPEHYLTTKES